MKTLLFWRTQLLAVAFLTASSAVVHAQFAFTTNNGAITITGYTGSGGAVVIPATTNGWPVTTIASNAFSSDTTITSLTIPEGITNVGENAFSGCIQLTSISFPDSVTTIGTGVCQGCSSLTNFSIGAGLANIGPGIAPAATFTGLQIVDGCTNLSAITVDPNNPVFSSSNGVLFAYGQQLLVRFPQGIGGSYTIPDSVTNTTSEAFLSCSNLGSITIGSGLSGMGFRTFYWCPNITNVTISSGFTNLTAISYYAGPGLWPVDFQDLTGLLSLMVESNNPAFSTIDGVLFDASQTTLIRYPSGRSGSYTIPYGVTTIVGDVFSSGAFANYLGLTTVTVPATVTNIENFAFYYCYNLYGMYFEGNAPSQAGTYPDVFSAGLEAPTIYYLPGTVGWGPIWNVEYTAPWFLPYPLILNGTAGVQTNQFTFTVSWATNSSVVVETATNLANPDWQPLATNPLAGGVLYFTDAAWTNYPARFYRVLSP